MSIDTVIIDQILEQLALNEKSRFNAYFVSSLSNQQNVDEVNDYLLMKAKFGALIVKIETICPENHIDQQFDFNHEFPTYELECRFCESDNSAYIPDPANTNVVFYFTEIFVESVKKKNVSTSLMTI